jgi:hypothetical protein
MSQVQIIGSHRLPPRHYIDINVGATSTLNAAGETQHTVGYIRLQNPYGGSKTISAAGGGRIVWDTSSVTFANAGTTFKVGIQDVSTATSPAQGDGTFDVEASFTGGGGGVTANTTQTSVMTTGTKTIAHGNLIAITFAMTARGGTDSIAVENTHPGVYSNGANLPAVTNNTGGSYTKLANAIPNCYIIFDDGTIGWFLGCPFIQVQPTGLPINSGTATADEYGNIINSPTTFLALGMEAELTINNTSADFEMLLYSDPLGTPVVERIITIDATQVASTNVGWIGAMFTTPFLIKANTLYCISVRPTTVNNVQVYYLGSNNSTGASLGVSGSQHYACRRLNNAGAFSDYNGGTAQTRVMMMNLIGDYREQGVNMCSGQVGVY